MAKRRGPRRRTVEQIQADLHPGVLAVGGQPTPEECEHPKGRRDFKNPRLCRACGGPVPDGVK